MHTWARAFVLQKYVNDLPWSGPVARHIIQAMMLAKKYSSCKI
jgi:hypothetical protein